jgi:hypothetical protein
LVVNDGSFENSFDFYVVPPSSLQPFSSFDDSLDSSEQSHAVPCNETQSDVLRDEEQASAAPETSYHESDAFNDQIAPFSSLNTPLPIDYLNPKPEDILWGQVCQLKYTQDYMASTGGFSSLDSNVDSDWRNSLLPIDMLCPSNLSLERASGVGPNIWYPPTHVSELAISSSISRSVSEASLRKRSRSSRSSSPEPDRQHKRVMSSNLHQCQWATCLENFDQAAKLRNHARTHASSQTKCLWSGCLRVSESTPELKRHLDSHMKPHICSKCQHQAATARDLSRHTLIHGFAPGTAIYYCPSHTCPYREGGHKLPFGRRDNAIRHINKKHPGSSDGPVPGIY